MRSTGSIPILPVTLILAIALVAGSLGGYFWYMSNTQEPAGEEALIVQSGYTISVNYIGMFEDGKVFDTSIMSVNDNDALYPKALSYERKFTASPLNFTVGGGQMVAGFEKGVVGMYVGETKDIVVSPKDGYGSSDPLKIVTKTINEEVSVYYRGMKFSDFQQNYSISPSVGMTVKNPYWGWNMTVTRIDTQTQTLTLKETPDVGMVVTPHVGWDSVVVSVDQSANNGNGKITVRNILTASDVNAVNGQDKAGNFRVVGLDAAAGTYTADYNREVVGQTLIFRVTVISATKPAA